MIVQSKAIRPTHVRPIRRNEDQEPVVFSLSHLCSRKKEKEVITAEHTNVVTDGASYVTRHTHVHKHKEEDIAAQMILD